MGSNDIVASLINFQKVKLVQELFEKSDETAEKLRDCKERIVEIGHSIGDSEQEKVKISNEQTANKSLEEEMRRKLRKIREEEKEALEEVERLKAARQDLSNREGQLSEQLDAAQRMEAESHDYAESLETDLKWSATRNYNFTHRYTRPYMIAKLEDRADKDSELARSWMALKANDRECQDHHFGAVAEEIGQILREHDNGQPKDTQERSGPRNTDRSVGVEEA